MTQRTVRAVAVGRRIAAPRQVGAHVAGRDASRASIVRLGRIAFVSHGVALRSAVRRLPSIQRLSAIRRSSAVAGGCVLGNDLPLITEDIAAA
jgi:hypothetical protein